MGDENTSESAPEFHSAVANLAVKIALAEAVQGVYETGDKDHAPNENYGPRVDEYQRTANQTLGQAWCAKFVYWCFQSSGYTLRRSSPLGRSKAMACW